MSPATDAWADSSAQSSSTVRTQDTTVEQDINVEPGNDRSGNDGLLDGLLGGNNNNGPGNDRSGNDGLLDGLLGGNNNNGPGNDGLLGNDSESDSRSGSKERDSSGSLGLF